MTKDKALQVMNEMNIDITKECPDSHGIEIQISHEDCATGGKCSECWIKSLEAIPE